MAVEIELKYAAEESAFEGLLAESSEWTRYEMATTYYDTPEAYLGKLRWTLRRRFENGVSVCTVKTPAGGMGRNEFEVECDDIREAIPQLCAIGAPRELLTLTADGESGIPAEDLAQVERLVKENPDLILIYDTQYPIRYGLVDSGRVLELETAVVGEGNASDWLTAMERNAEKLKQVGGDAP